MTVSDPIADMLTRIRNACGSKHRRVDVPASRIKLEIARLQRKIQQDVQSSIGDTQRNPLMTGKVAKLEALRQKHPASVVALMRIPGLGPKSVTRLRAELGVQSIDDLRAVLAARKLRELRGFGQSSEEKLARALARIDEEGTAGRTPISVALPLAAGLCAARRFEEGIELLGRAEATSAALAGDRRKLAPPHEARRRYGGGGAGQLAGLPVGLHVGHARSADGEVGLELMPHVRSKRLVDVVHQQRHDQIVAHQPAVRPGRFHGPPPPQVREASTRAMPRRGAALAASRRIRMASKPRLRPAWSTAKLNCSRIRKK